LIGDIPGVAKPTQKWFDSQLVERLRRFDPALPIWVESESKKIGAIQVPSALLETMHGARLFSLGAPMAERVALWREDYGHIERNLDAMIGRLRFLRTLSGSEGSGRCERLAAERPARELCHGWRAVHNGRDDARSIVESNACGKVPVLDDNRTILTESAAVCMHLAER